jgi:hypothetical protein
MKEFLEGELDRLATLQSQALENAAKGNFDVAAMRLEEAEHAVKIIEVIHEELEKGN